MRSVYKNVGDKEVTTKQQNGWVVVDYMFYSTNFSEKYNKFIEGNLKLVAKLDLWLVLELKDHSLYNNPFYFTRYVSFYTGDK